MRLILLTAVLAVLIAQSTTAGLFERDWRELDIETVTSHFRQVAFRETRGTYVLMRIEPDYDVTWTAINLSRSRVSEHLGRLALVTGLRFRYVESNRDASFVVARMPRSVIEEIRVMMGDAPDNMRNKLCDALAKHNMGLIFQGFVGIPDNTSETETQTCLIVETAQIMGLLWDIPVNYDTVTQAGYFTLDRLPEVDQLMLRILYDPRLKAGMTREEAMPIVQRILPEYWEKFGPDSRSGN